MNVRRSLAGLVVLGALLAATPGCELQGAKVAQGQLYLSGEARFDAYFRDVHALQVTAAGWVDEKKRTRRPLLGVLSLTPDAGDVTIVQATHDRLVSYTAEGGGTKLQVTPDEARVMVLPGTKGDPTFFRALEDTVRFEIDRDRKLAQALSQIEQLTKVGRSLEPHVHETFLHGTPGKVTEVKGELSSSLDVLAALVGKARSTSRESEDFIADLQRGASVAVDPPVKREIRPATTVALKPAIPARASVAASKPVAAKKPDDGVSAAPAPAAAPPKPAKPADTGEVFNP